MTDITVNIPTAVDAALALYKEHTKNKKLLDDTARVFIQVTMHKTPIVEETRRVYLYLDHCHAGNNPEICIFTQNAWPNDHIVRTPDEKIEFSIEHYEKIFREHSIKGISGIMPLKQLRNEYGPYELKRKLTNRFDLFLTDRSLLRKMKFTFALGKIFSKANKYPVGVKFPKSDEHDDNFQKRIEKALKTAYFSIKPHSNNYSIPVGVTSQTREQLIANATGIIQQIFNRSIIPGGSGNIKSILLKLDRSKAVPLYISLESKNNIPVPFVKSKVPKAEPVEGEISTRPGMKVIVMPDGEVIIKKMDDGGGSDVSDFEDDDDEEDEEEDEEDDSDADEPVKKESKAKKEKGTKKKDEEESDEEDQVAENAEQKYLSDWLDEINEDEEKNKEENQKGSKKGKKRKLGDTPATPEKKPKRSENQDKVNKKNQKKSGKTEKNQAEPSKINIGRKKNLSNKQKESPKLEKKGNKGKNVTGKQKKPSQLGKNKKAIIVEKNKKARQKQ